MGPDIVKLVMDGDPDILMELGEFGIDDFEDVDTDID